MASGTATSDVTDGPVLTLINKRIRNLRKKLNRIAQLEDSIAQGKSIIKNKEQEDLLKSKPTIVAAVDELEKFRQPLSVAVDEEINLALQRHPVVASENNDDDDNCNKAQTLNDKQQETEPPSIVVEDLLSLIYFASMFDVKSQSDFNSIMLTKTHERNCCLTYDYVTDDDAAVMLGEKDLDSISMMGSLLTSRPVDSSLSHQNALQRCIEHAKLWLLKSDQQIDLNSSVTYAVLREKLTKIMRSDFFKITPEMKATVDVAAEAAASYNFHGPVPVEGSVFHYDQEVDLIDLQRREAYEERNGPLEDSHENERDVEISAEVPVHAEPVEAHAGDAEYEEQQVPQRSYQNQRGGGRSGGGGRRSYPNGRGGRSVGRSGSYQNGRNQYYDQTGNHYPRSYYGGRGRGGRGNGSNGHNQPASGVQVAES